jgi:predicted short-subunit dehydrogenase-like oxidoreductase (DUF2520 family)
MHPDLGIVGAGKVGKVLAQCLDAAGYTIVAVHSRTRSHAALLAGAVGAEIAETPSEVVLAADLTLLTVPDDSILPVVQSLSAMDCSDKGVIHTSGVYDREALESLAARGAMTGSLHPAYPFADTETALAGISGATFAVEAEDPRLRDWLHEIVAALEGRVITIPPGGKALYHVALVMVSNYTVTLYAAAERLLVEMGAEPVAAAGVLRTLLDATMRNIHQQGIPAALTGPLVRADLGTVQAHLAALATLKDDGFIETYRSLARLSIPMLVLRDVPEEFIAQLERFLDQ